MAVSQRKYRKVIDQVSFAASNSLHHFESSNNFSLSEFRLLSVPNMKCSSPTVYLNYTISFEAHFKEPEWAIEDYRLAESYGAAITAKPPQEFYHSLFS